MSDRDLGLPGRITKAFQAAEITPLLALAGLLLGLFAIVITPKEEEPQIDVTMVDVFIPFPGASPAEIEHLVATPAEQVLSEIEGIEHVWSLSRPGLAALTVQYQVGEARTDALVRLYNKLYSNRDWLPSNLGVGEPLVKPRGIDDVPVMAVTLWSDAQEVGSHELLRVAHSLEAELKRIPGTRDIRTIGGPDDVVAVELDPVKLSAHGVSFGELRSSLLAANRSGPELNITRDNTTIPVQAGDFLATVEEVRQLVVRVVGDRPVYLEDVATVARMPDTPERSVFMGFGTGDGPGGLHPAVTLQIAKKPGTNAVDVTQAIARRVVQLEGLTIPEGVRYTITRDYGATAADKANTLITKLVFATASVVLLVLITLGWREATVVGAAVVITLLITLFGSWAWGFTINRVSLFALIFSIGILVDDAIVVVENIHRHLALSDRSLLEVMPVAVDEVGGPTVLATFTVIAALLPMAFVTGLMGPYMSPIPINASTGMLISLVVAFVVTPWFAYRLIRRHVHHASEQQGESRTGRLLRFFERLMTPFLRGRHGRVPRWGMLVAVIVLIAAALALPATNLVVLKMLPFDDKSEFQVIVDMPEGTPVEQTQRVLSALGRHLEDVPELANYQTYAGTAAPINFNGLVRQYYRRAEPHLGDVQVNLVDKDARGRKSHEIALAVRAPLQAIGDRFDANVKIVEVPPGPPVQAPIVAEVYGPTYERQIASAHSLREVFASTDGIVDVDDSVEAPALKYRLTVDREKAARLGVAQETVIGAVTTALGGEDVSYLHERRVKYALPIRLEFSAGDKADLESFLRLRVRSRSGDLVALSEIAGVVETTWETTIYHKDLMPVVFVTANMAGELDSPLYGMFDMVSRLWSEPLPNGDAVSQHFVDQPGVAVTPSIKWDGEWQVTYETFRDMGIAYAVGMVLIYLLVVAQFRSYGVPLIIMAPIPLTIIGVMPGHALLDAKFTATSMIGMIALAGIIVRNSILLVDFIDLETRAGTALHDAVIRAAAVRARPIALTGVAAMIGAFFIIDDPIFNGLAISLIFGIFVSTVLTLLVIPVLYYAWRYRGLAAEAQ
ncbi:efflux RND transporter permease subunit [Arhodomonas sp. AD133]|uniref:efflux RND transporter permease subunit n=1 Tax=Arhodomonas sp. AD133 TaxID=3415009 RepID=UPI003EBFB4AD